MFWRGHKCQRAAGNMENNMRNRKAIMPDWLKWAIIIMIFLAVAAAILWQAYNGGLDIIKNPGVFKFKI